MWAHKPGGLLQLGEAKNSYSRNLLTSFGAIVGSAFDSSETSKGQKIGGYVNDAITIGLTGGFLGTLTTIFDSPNLPIWTKIASGTIQIGVWYDVLNNGGKFNKF
jgi:hypothetical protein